MTDIDIINSDSYWNTRFAENWEACEGPKQSRFFARIAVEHLPHWLMEQLKRQSLTLADWGCAQGDGTNVWASYIDAQQIVGVDFSSMAIEQAVQRYPAIRFINEDWLEEGGEQRETFDVVFSSNTLEHFHKPYETLHAICSRAKKAIVLALPYKEIERIDEHFYSFLPENIPLQLANGFRLIWSRVVDCRPLPKTLWSGDQIILAYADPKWLDSLRLTLNDCHIEQIDASTEIARLNTLLAERDGKIATLTQTITEHNGRNASVNQAVADRNAQVGALNAKIEEVSTWGKSLQGSLAESEQEVIDLAQDIAQWRDKAIELSDWCTKQQNINAVLRTEMMSVSDWANHINSSPIAYAAKKYALKLARAAFKALPLNLEVKHRLRNGLRRFNPLRARIVSASTGLTSAQIQSVVQTRSVLDQTKHRDVFVFSVIDWHFRIQRPQQLARSFAKAGSRVFFFSNHFVDTDEPGYQIERLDPSLPLYQIKLHVKGAPAIYFAPPTQKAEAMLEASIARLIMDFAALSNVTVVEHAYWYALVCRLPNTYRVYDCMDNHEGFGNVPEKLIEIEKDMLQRSDLVVVTSSWLESFACDFNQNIAVVRNACEYEHFANRPDDVYVDPQGRKIVGYYGAIAEWFDLDLIRAVALANPDHLILLVGNDTVSAGSALEDLPNVAFTGEVPYVKLPFYLYAFDVCLLPFKVIPLTLATNPVKIYEYLAAGKLVVSVDLPEIAQFGDLVWRATSANEFVKLVGRAMKLQDSSDEVSGRERKTFAAQQTWDHRASELSGALRSIEMPKISVVVLTYNNLDLTKACLQSLIEQTDYPNLEIIVVDNASVDGTPSYLNEFRQQHQNTKVILNEKNIGFSAGNNVGLAAAMGDYLVLLNNDTVVTRGWAMTLMRHLQADSSIGLVGPVTNNIGNEARIETTYKDISDMPVEALQYTLSNMGRILPIRNVAFFCVMMPRTAFASVGILDEAFGRGFFEDDDYCRRIEQLGLRIVCAKDVFIHHHLSASFNKLRSADRQALFEQNKAIYEAKWGTWTPHTYKNVAKR